MPGNESSGAVARGLPTLRARLTLWSTAIISSCVVLFSLAVGALFRAHVAGELERQVHEDIELAARALTIDAEGRVGWPGGFLSSVVEEDEGGGHRIEVFDRGGHPLLAGGTIPLPVLPPPRAPEEARSVVGPAGPARVKTEEVRLGDTTLLVRAAISEAGAHGQVRRLWFHLAGFSLAMVGLGAAGTALLTGRLLGPLSRLAARARQITAEQLHERLPAAPTVEVEQLREAFNETLARLERSFDQLRRFTADASHELRTPLTALRAVGEVGLRGARTPEQYREVIGSMLEEVDRLSRLADELLTLARGESGEARLRPEPLDLAALAAELAAEIGILAEERGQRVETAVRGPVPVTADRVAVRQAVLNLVDNAIKYAPKGSRVLVRTGSTAAAAWVEVVDEGPGIAAEHRERVFDRFYRVDKSRSREVGGTGLGLSLAKWAAEAHGGRVELESEEGRGSTFRFVLPGNEAPR
jgi:heavy metal sensor kinase